MIEVPQSCVGGNISAGKAVIACVVEGYSSFQRTFQRNLLASLQSGAKSRDDARDLMPAAIRFIAGDRPPIDLRLDHVTAPWRTLSDLAARFEVREYQSLMKTLWASLVLYPDHLVLPNIRLLKKAEIH